MGIVIIRWSILRTSSRVLSSGCSGVSRNFLDNFRRWAFSAFANANIFVAFPAPHHLSIYPLSERERDFDFNKTYHVTRLSHDQASAAIGNMELRDKFEKAADTIRRGIVFAASLYLWILGIKRGWVFECQAFARWLPLFRHNSLTLLWFVSFHHFIEENCLKLVTSYGCVAKTSKTALA